jgi:hypothetical protein
MKKEWMCVYRNLMWRRIKGTNNKLRINQARGKFATIHLEIALPSRPLSQHVQISSQEVLGSNKSLLTFDMTQISQKKIIGHMKTDTQTVR